MTYQRTERLRRAAILVASLDDALAERLLAELPAAERTRVLDEAERLETIDADEQQDVLAEFRRMTRSGAPAGGVEFESSSSREASERPSHATLPASAEATDQRPGLSPPDAAAMAEVLMGEHPQIVAAALSRLGEEQCAAVFAALPAELQAETLERLAAMAPIDEAAALEVESQLQSRLEERRARQARATASAELVQKILARTAPERRAALLERIAAKDVAPEPRAATPAPVAPSSSRRNTPAEPVARQAADLAASVRDAHDGRPSSRVVADCTAELSELSDEALVAALRAADEATVMRALAASGESFLERVTNMLPRRQAKALRRMLRNLGPTRLADLQHAQMELLRLAEESDVASAAA